MASSSSSSSTAQWSTIWFEWSHFFFGESLWVTIILNIVRDVAWTYLSIYQISPSFKEDDPDSKFDIHGTWLGQFMYSTVFMLPFFLYSLYILNEKEN